MPIDVTGLPAGERPGVLVRSTADAALVLLPRRRRDALLARVHAARLDALLAGGAAPEDSRLLAVRAALLTSPHHRHALADAWLDLLGRARGSWSVLDTRVPVDRAAVLAAAPAIERLAAELRRPAPVAAGAVARTSTLLTRGTSAVYTGGDLDSQVSDLVADLTAG